MTYLTLSKFQNTTATAVQDVARNANDASDTTRTTDSLVVIRDSIEETEQVIQVLTQTSKTLSMQAQEMEQVIGCYRLPTSHG